MGGIGITYWNQDIFFNSVAICGDARDNPALNHKNHKPRFQHFLKMLYLNSSKNRKSRRSIPESELVDVKGADFKLQ